MELRNYLPADLEVVSAIWLTSVIAAHPSLPEDLWIARYGKMYHEILPAAQTVIASVEGEPEGFLSLGEGGEIIALSVAVCFQKKQHGTALLCRAKELCPAGLRLSVLAENERAVTFFEKNGFVPAGQTTDAETGHPMLLMAWQPQCDTQH